MMAPSRVASPMDPASLDLDRISSIDDVRHVRAAVLLTRGIADNIIAQRTERDVWTPRELEAAALRLQDLYDALPPRWRWRERPKSEFEDIRDPELAWYDLPPLGRINFDDLLVANERTNLWIRDSLVAVHMYAGRRVQSLISRAGGLSAEANAIMQSAMGSYNKLPPRWRW